jgi:Type II CAAX prenyl endopeptidase Rce1-like
MITFVHALAMIAVLLVYYRWLFVKALDALRTRMRIPPLDRRFPARDVDGAVRLVLAATLQAMFFAVLYAIYLPESLHLSSLDASPALLALAIVLGVGEMGLATLLGLSAIQVTDLIDRFRRLPPTDWPVVARGGWMQQYLKVVVVFPRWAVAATLLGYVGFEEAIFRGLIISVFAPMGDGLALVISVCTFVLVQTFHTPGWRTAMFPAIGAAVMGTVHGLLFLAVPSIVPLAVAHAAFFVASLSVSCNLARQRRISR